MLDSRGCRSAGDMEVRDSSGCRNARSLLWAGGPRRLQGLAGVP